MGEGGGDISSPPLSHVVTCGVKISNNNKCSRGGGCILWLPCPLPSSSLPSSPLWLLPSSPSSRSPSLLLLSVVVVIVAALVVVEVVVVVVVVVAELRWWWFGCGCCGCHFGFVEVTQHVM